MDSENLQSVQPVNGREKWRRFDAKTGDVKTHICPFTNIERPHCPQVRALIHCTLAVRSCVLLRLWRGSLTGFSVDSSPHNLPHTCSHTCSLVEAHTAGVAMRDTHGCVRSASELQSLRDCRDASSMWRHWSRPRAGTTATASPGGRTRATKCAYLRVVSWPVLQFACMVRMFTCARRPL